MFAQTRPWQAVRCRPTQGSRRVLTRCGAELGTGRGPRLHLSAHVARRGGWFCVAAEGKMRELGDGRVCLDSGVLLECHSLCRTPFPPQQTRGASSARSAQAPGRGAQGTGAGDRAQALGAGARALGVGAGDRGAGRRCGAQVPEHRGAGTGRRCPGAGRRCRAQVPGCGVQAPGRGAQVPGPGCSGCPGPRAHLLKALREESSY